MTSVAPAGVAAIAEQIPSTDNPRVNLDLAEVALLLPPRTRRVWCRGRWKRFVAPT